MKINKMAFNPAISDVLKNNINSILANPFVSIYWKNKNGMYLDVNDTFVKTATVHVYKDIIGSRDRDLAWSEQSSIIESNDQEVMFTGKSRSMIESVKCLNDRVSQFLSHKIPLKTDQGTIIGLLGISYMLDDPRFMQNNQRANSVFHQYNISHRERQCLECYFQGKTAKETAEMLQLSYRTVEEYIGNAKKKLRCKNKRDLMKYFSLIMC